MHCQNTTAAQDKLKTLTLVRRLEQIFLKTLANAGVYYLIWTNSPPLAAS
jgi:hypothetical protein